MGMAKTTRAKITTYVRPDLRAWLDSRIESSDHNRETLSSYVENLLLKDRDLHKGRPTQRPHRAPLRSA